MTQTRSRKLNALLEQFERITDPEERSLVLIGYAEKFRGVAPEVARRPYSANQRVPFCESEAYAWLIPRSDGTLELSIAVENPSGISAKALAVILTETLSGSPAGEIASITPDIVTDIFRENISMGKGMGLTGMVEMIRMQALEYSRKAVLNPLPSGATRA